MAKNNAVFINQDVIETLLAAGINPRTGLPLKYGGSTAKCELKANIKKQLRIIDEQDAINRFQWYNLPLDISSQELERLLYYKGQLCFFYFEELKKFYVMPYALDGAIDFYGRFVTVHPIPFAEGVEDEKLKQSLEKQRAILSAKKLKVLYDVPTEPLFGKPGDYCVLINDYCKQYSQTIISRQIIQDGLLDVMADCIPFMRTALQNASGVQGMRVGSEDEQSNVKAANMSVDAAALSGQRWIPIIGNIDFQDLASNGVGKSEEFLLAMQSLDNFRLSTYGLENGGLFEKKQYQNNTQTMINGSGQIGNPLQDSLSYRQKACDIINAVWGVGVSCEITEVAAGMDLNMDGITANDTEQSGSEVKEQTTND